MKSPAIHLPFSGPRSGLLLCYGGFPVPHGYCLPRPKARTSFSNRGTNSTRKVILPGPWRPTGLDKADSKVPTSTTTWETPSSRRGILVARFSTTNVP